MTLLDILRSPWAIEPDRLDQLQAMYATHLQGDKIDIASVEAKLGRPLNNQATAYEVLDGGVALLSLDGVIAPKANLFTQISGGVSAQIAEKAILDALADPSVNSMVLAIDSPGGNVHGIPEVAAALSRFSAEKPSATLATGVMASAAYWIGAAANAVFVTGPTVTVGSIGVVATHDYSPRESGRVVTEIAAGKYKRMGTSGEPLSKEGRAYIQSQVDYLYSVFVDSVAQSRGATTEQVLTHMADGRVFSGQQAIDAGLADGVFAMDQLIDAMATKPEQFSKRRKAVFSLPTPSKGAGAAPKDTKPPKGTTAMSDETLSRASLEQDHAPLFAQVKAEFMALGAQQERDRIAGVRAQSMPGHEALIDKLSMDGTTTPGEAAMAVMAAHREAMNAIKAAFENDAPEAAKPSAAPVDKAEKSGADKVAEAKAYAAEHGLEFVAALKKLGYAA